MHCGICRMGLLPSSATKVALNLDICKLIMRIISIENRNKTRQENYVYILWDILYMLLTYLIRTLEIFFYL